MKKNSQGQAYGVSVPTQGWGCLGGSRVGRGLRLEGYRRIPTWERGLRGEGRLQAHL